MHPYEYGGFKAAGSGFICNMDRSRNCAHTGGRSSGIIRMNYGLYAWRNVAAVIRLFFIQKL